tara:strand:+ start:1693 stop:2082 length:390 start_codon:yes stop_codon:yes gene_type:complete
MKNQLFKKEPDNEIIDKLLEGFGLESLNDCRHFSRDDLKKLDTVEKLYEIKKELNNYYIPCKARTYLNDLNEKNIITILKQFIKVKGYTIISREKYSNKKKFIIYQLITLEQKDWNPINIKNNLCVNFE